MLNIPAPTTSAFTRTTGETVQITEWTIGAYTLRKAVDPDYTGWAVITSDSDLPYVGYKDGDPNRPIFGVSCYSEPGLTPSGAVAYAAQIMEAAQAASTFNEIVANR